MQICPYVVVPDLERYALADSDEAPPNTKNSVLNSFMTAACEALSIIRG